MARTLIRPGHPLRIARSSERGQALVETALVVGFLVMLLVGIVEFGRAWMVVSMIRHAARDGARAAAVAPSSSRVSCGDGTSGCLSSSTMANIDTLVLNEIQAAMDTSTLTKPPLSVSQTTSNGIPIVTVQVTGTVPYIFRIWGSSFGVNLSATFRDEGK